MSAQHLQTRTPMGGRSVAVLAAALAFTVVLSAGAVLWAVRWATRPSTPSATLAASPIPSPITGPTPSPASSATARAASGPAPTLTRLAVTAAPRRLLDTRATGGLAPGALAALPLPALPAGAVGVLLELSMLDAAGPGVVTVGSAVEQVPALRLAAAKASTSATVVALIGPDGALSVRTEGGGKLVVDLVGVFEPAASSTSGRLVAVPATQVLRLRPGVDGNDTDLQLGELPALRDAGSVSAVLLHFSGDVGHNGGLVSVGPSAATLNQEVDWGATSGTDRTRDGFLVVPVTQLRLHLHYHAGTELRVDVVGYLTGDRAPDSAAGLLVPLPYQAGTAFPVPAGGSADVTLVPAAGRAGALPARVTAALLTLGGSTGSPGGIALTSAGSTGPTGSTAAAGTASSPTLSAGVRPRSTLALAGVAGGAVTVSSRSAATVTLIPRALVVSG